MTFPCVSFVMATHNRPAKLKKLLQSLLAQNAEAGGFEIIVVDDGSKPPVDLGEFPDVILLRTEGVERCHARNTGAQRARGELLVILDDDITVGPNFMAEHLKAQAKWPGEMIIGAVEFPPAVLKTPFGAFRQSIVENDWPVGWKFEPKLTDSPMFATAQNMALPRERFLELGGFDPESLNTEDQDLAIRHIEKGGKVGFWPVALGLHNDDAVTIRTYCKRAQWGVVQHVRFVKKHPNRPENRERQAINGPLRIGREPRKRTVWKIAKQILFWRPLLEFLFVCAEVLEHFAPRAARLKQIYRLLIGIHLQYGYRLGLKKFGGPKV